MGVLQGWEGSKGVGRRMGGNWWAVTGQRLTEQEQPHTHRTNVFALYTNLSLHRNSEPFLQA